MRHFILFFLALISVSLTQAQNNDCGSLQLNQASKITQQVELYQQQNELLKKTRGYRVQIHFGNSRDGARDAKSKFMQSGEGESKHVAYEMYQQPNYKIRIGDFRTRLEAYQFLKEIHGAFPNSFLVEDDINFPPLN